MQKYIIFIITCTFSLQLIAEDIKSEMPKIETMVKISEMYGRDQGIRMAPFYLHTQGFTVEAINSDPDLKAKTLEIDKANVTEIKKIVAEHGWPNISKFNSMTDLQVGIMVRHATHDPQFQEAMLRLLHAEAKAKTTNLSNFAFLFDIVNIAKGKEQVYGTQGYCKAKGDWQPHRMQNEEKVDAYRKGMDLKPLADFKEQMNASCV